ncbi:hypothetical protein JTI58_21655 [Lysinibacillus fusiformis]|uniref:hypothetical protein n=1 Tax=Lysinibacillus fusiformis TaxID=28031 RepID=UPI00196872F1|nr:hypothetical protein [Lysinibacillus fusiformis]QSB09559.1 hypothetical protein JTI58_21655 [Lysinibacillus fusiformis]
MRAFIILLQIVRWLFILVICCAGIILGAVILGMMGIDVPNIEPILNIASVPILLFRNNISLIIINIFVIFVLLYFQLRTLKKANKE